MNARAVAAALVVQADTVRARLDRFVRLPSISTDPAYAGGMRGAQQFLLAWLREIGLQDVQALDGGGHPRDLPRLDSRTRQAPLLTQGHYDVQPPDPVDEWLSRPPGKAPAAARRRRQRRRPPSCSPARCG